MDLPVCPEPDDGTAVNSGADATPVRIPILRGADGSDGHSLRPDAPSPRREREGPDGE